MITADQLVCHMVGDYILQSDWMAGEKTKAHFPAAVHAVTYTLPFLFLTYSWRVLLVVCLTHFLIDRFRLARYVVWFKNYLGPGNRPWSECKDSFGYAPDRPAWMTCWLTIIADNCIHILLNGAAFQWL